nr:AAA family ATPase [uncultured Leptotrichia sp.]
MKLSIKNVGKLKEADVEINGITVIAGENNTGKSTVSKTLFSLFNGFYNLDNRILETRLRDVRDIFIRYRGTKEINEQYREILDKLSKELIKNDEYKNDENKIYGLIKENKNFISERQLEYVSKIIFNILNITYDTFSKTIISGILNSEFGNQINTIDSDKSGEMILKIQNDELKIVVDDDKVSKNIENRIDIYSKIIYIDDPFVIDNLSELSNLDTTHFKNHKENLEVELFFSDKANFSEGIIMEKKLRTINEKLKKVIDGKIKISQRKWVYEFESNKELNLKNLSAGLKSFAILKRLLENGKLKENGTIILDEPEIHLHPEWQLKFAELIVLLQKEFGMHILLTTHSPYFLNAIEVFSERHKIDDKCKYYVAENEGNSSIIKDVTGNTREIYRKLARPIQDLENIRYSSDLDE